MPIRSAGGQDERDQEGGAAGDGDDANAGGQPRLSVSGEPAQDGLVEPDGAVADDDVLDDGAHHPAHTDQGDQGCGQGQAEGPTGPQPASEEVDLALVAGPQAGDGGALELGRQGRQEAVTVAAGPAGGDHDAGGEDGHQEQDEGGAAGDVLDLGPAVAREVAGQCEARGPHRAAGGVVGEEPPVGHPRHAGQAGDEDTQGGGEAPEEDRLPAAAAQVALGALEMLGFEEPADAALEPAELAVARLWQPGRRVESPRPLRGAALTRRGDGQHRELRPQPGVAGGASAAGG